MLQLQTVAPDTLELLKTIVSKPEMKGFRHSMKYPNYSIFRALLSLTYFDDAETQAMPKIFIPQTWEVIKAYISDKVKECNR